MMKKVNTVEMRAVEGGKYAYCPVCGKRTNLRWTLSVLFYGWKFEINRAENGAALRHAWGGKCW